VNRDLIIEELVDQINIIARTNGYSVISEETLDMAIAKYKDLYRPPKIPTKPKVTEDIIDALRYSMYELPDINKPEPDNVVFLRSRK